MKYKLNGVIFEENCNLMYVGVFDTKHNPLVLSLGELLWLGATPIDDKPTEHYKCPSYYDNNNQLQDCTCGKCGKPIKIEKLQPSYAGAVLVHSEGRLMWEKINEIIEAVNSLKGE